MENRTNLSLQAQESNSWASAVNPNPREASAQNALSIIRRFTSETRAALRDGVAVISFPDLGLLSKLRPVPRTEEGDMEYPTAPSVSEEYRMNVLLRVVNGKLYNNVGQLDCYAHDMKTYQKAMRRARVIGCNSPEAQNELNALLATMVNPEEAEELRATMALFAIDFQMGYTTPDWRQVVEVTQEMYDAGLTSVVNDWESEKSGWAVTQLNVGDFLVFTTNGVYVIRREEFIETHSTFVI